jgi:transcriptional regulator with XRE-family HTH domain
VPFFKGYVGPGIAVLSWWVARDYARKAEWEIGTIDRTAQVLVQFEQESRLKEDIMTEFAHELRSQRREAGLSQSALAREVGKHPSYVNRLESGEREPSSWESVQALAEALGLGLSERNKLLLAARYMPVMLDVAQRQDERLQLIADVLTDRRVPDSDKKYLEDFARRVNDRYRKPDTER